MSLTPFEQASCANEHQLDLTELSKTHPELTGKLEQVLKTVSQRSAEKALDAFEDTLFQSVSAIFKPHIAGVAAVVKQQVLSPTNVDDGMQSLANAFCREHAGAKVCVCELVVDEGKFTLTVTDIDCPEKLDPRAIYPVNPEAFSFYQYDEKSLMGDQVLFCSPENRDSVVAQMKAAWAERANKQEDSYRQRANALSTLYERLLG